VAPQVNGVPSWCGRHPKSLSVLASCFLKLSDVADPSIATACNLSANSWAMDTVARDSWNFNGYTTSDCGAVAGVSNPEPKSHPWYESRHDENDDGGGNSSQYVVAATAGAGAEVAPAMVGAEGISSAGGHGYQLPNGSSLASGGLDSNCNLAGGSVDSREGPEGDAARRSALEHLFAVQVRPSD
jgi:hypothetical protein